MTTPACCPSGSWPQLLRPKSELNGDTAPTLAGSVITLDDSPTKASAYVVEPKAGVPFAGLLMVFPDIYSVRALTPDCRSGDRIGAICDALAEKGYRVALLGLFGDKSFDLAITAPEDGDFEKFDSFAQDGGVDWFKQQNYEKMSPEVKACGEYLQDKSPADNKAVGVVGFCYGTWLLSKTSSMGGFDFSCAVGCHPATALEGLYGGDEVAMMNSVKMPTLFLWAGNDSDIYLKDGAGKAALEKSGGSVVEFPDMLHGWVSRGDVGDEKVKRDFEKAIELMMDFLDQQMK
eukprot:CAMPEP_0172470992 /NCGR_PEP_ID=MMETSP1065-20121228/67586_1 /TAXON_ID=265537 /ORGANISM="Amphiprora paludosa, Strain CCMP125" /LENGTH=289 /DNA_ID=CAMNT_0013229075 /DNA_START=128 /DNA_END=997 /DNA_ORIENTATION=-